MGRASHSRPILIFEISRKGNRRFRGPKKREISRTWKKISNFVFGAPPASFKMGWASNSRPILIFEILRKANLPIQGFHFGTRMGSLPILAPFYFSRFYTRTAAESGVQNKWNMPKMGKTSQISFWVRAREVFKLGRASHSRPILIFEMSRK